MLFIERRCQTIKLIEISRQGERGAASTFLSNQRGKTALLVGIENRCVFTISLILFLLAENSH